MTTDRALFLPEEWPTSRVRVAVIGAGGSGSQLADQLASMEATLKQLGHPGFAVSLYDGDTVSRSNLGRQRFTASDIGLNKAVILVHRINLFYQTDWTAVPAYCNPHSLSADLVITAVDKASFRSDLGKAFRQRRTEAIWIDVGNGSASSQAVIGHLGNPSDQARCPNVADLWPELANMSTVDNEQPSCSAEQAIRRQPWPINRVVTIAAMEMLWTLFREGKLTHHGIFLEMNPLRTTHLPVNPDQWAMFGYKSAELTA